MGAAESTPDGPEYRLEKERLIAIEAVLKGCEVAQTVAKSLNLGETISKNDASPVTVADFSVQAVINTYLKKNFAEDSIVAEEKSQDLNESLKQRVVSIVNSVIDEPGLTEQQVLDAIDYGGFEGGAKGRFWTLDPIDGTKGFLRAEQYAVCLALIENGVPVLGVLGCPNLPVDPKDPSGKKGCIFWAIEGRGAYTRGIEETTFRKIHTLQNVEPKDTSFVESVESGHSSHSDSNTIATNLGVTAAPVRMDSQAKYGALSRGDACIYLRLPVSRTYEEKIWDHAAGHIIVKEAGGSVQDTTGAELDFSQGRTLKKNKGVVASSSSDLQTKVIHVVKEVLYPAQREYKVVVKGTHIPTAQELQKALVSSLSVESANVDVKLV